MRICGPTLSAAITIVDKAITVPNSFTIEARGEMGDHDRVS